MSGIELRTSASVTLSIEYSHFTVAGEQLNELDAGTEALDGALASPARVAAVRDVLVVLSPAADTHETPVVLEVCRPARPRMTPAGTRRSTSTSWCPRDASRWARDRIPRHRGGIDPGGCRLSVSGGRVRSVACQS
jgi:hypothetical protein